MLAASFVSDCFVSRGARVLRYALRSRLCPRGLCPLVPIGGRGQKHTERHNTIVLYRAECELCDTPCGLGCAPRGTTPLSLSWTCPSPWTWVEEHCSNTGNVFPYGDWPQLATYMYTMYTT